MTANVSLCPSARVRQRQSRHPADVRGHLQRSAPARAYRSTVQFSPELRAGVASGEITVSIRLWSRPQVRLGGRYGAGAARIEIDDIDLVPFDTISAADVRRSGEANRESLRKRAAHAGPIDDDTLVYRIEFHIVP